MKLIFFGSDGLALPTLQLLAQQPWCQISLVITPPDKPSGRKQHPTPTAVKQLARELGLPFADSFNALPPADIGVVVYYGIKIPASVMAHFPRGIINIHPSLLPQWRGPAPIKAALLAGATHTGVSIMLIDQGLDTGPLLAQELVPIQTEESAIDLERRLGSIGAAVLIKTLPGYLAGTILPRPQATAGVSVTHCIDRTDGELKTNATPQELWNRYRAMQPWPGVYFMQQGQRYKITQARWQDNRFIAEQIQPEGKKAMSLADFKRGYPQILFSNII